MPADAPAPSLVAGIDALLERGLPKMMPLMRRLFPLCRSLTGPGVRQTLDALGEVHPLDRRRVPTGSKCFDWEVPREWSVRQAYVKNEKGEKVIDFAVNNLHLVGYSVPIRRSLSLKELQEHLHSLPDDPDAIPYRTSYYNESWGFCLAHSRRESLSEGRYDVVIDSTLEPGHMDYGEAFLGRPGSPELFFSTYICHPSMANNELSGPVLVANLMALLRGLPTGRYAYRALFAPETIGALAFLAERHEELKRTMTAGYVVTCVGDDGPFTYVRSKRGNTPADKAAAHALAHVARRRQRPVTVKGFDPIGSDERQYCSPGFNLPVGSILRSRHGEYREYHTSNDDLTFVSEEGLAGGLEAYLRVIQTLEMNCRPLRTNPYGEPQLGKRGLYNNLGVSVADDWIVTIMNILSFADGDHDLIDIAERLGRPVWELREPLRKLVQAELLRLDLTEAPS